MEFTKFDISDKDMQNVLARAYESKMNVLLEGKPGMIKTMNLVKWCEANLGDKDLGKWAYFSAPTMDPWVDLIGIPFVDPKTGHLSFKKNPIIQENCEVLIIDELNATTGKVLNAFKELLQFKTINGQKFPNLKVVWSSLNNFDTLSELDDAILSRYHIKLSVECRNLAKAVSDFIPDKKFVEVVAQFMSRNQDLYISARDFANMFNLYKNGLPIYYNLKDYDVRFEELDRELTDFISYNDIWSCNIDKDRVKKDHSYQLKIADLIFNYMKRSRDKTKIMMLAKYQSILSGEVLDNLKIKLQVIESQNP